ncbi:carbohydrate kinase family protein [Nonomuraea basaltis]|uniref:carbohydrate kinase family protein n=1 Tax=Nonomuraea basaltis TaxID=2495887 RepID=UPI00110C42F6|nr:carbohydrate kinase family protein [Nonomuraea basaltis]TMR90263.1 carbohydrate kinase family protein [Nonomuraea basaltis]
MVSSTSDQGQLDVFVSGLLFFDVVFSGLDHAPKLGAEAWTREMASGPGGIANFAYALSRLGLRTGLAAAFGDDPFGRYCWDALAEQEGVDLSRSRRFPGWATPTTVSLAYEGDRALVTHGAPPPLLADDLIGDPPVARAAIVHLRPEPVEWPRGTGGLVFGDVGWDPTLRWPRSMLDQLGSCHAFMPNAHEAMSYTRTDTPSAALSKLADLVPLAVVTRGADGAIAVDGISGETADVGGLPIDVVDPTGAGDIFGAALVVATLAGLPLAERLRFANLAAALSVGRVGGALSAPTWADLGRWWHGITAPEIRRDYAFISDLLEG